MCSWKIFQGNNTPPHRVDTWPETPPWRRFSEAQQTKDETSTRNSSKRGESFVITDERVIETVNAAIYLRRPILVTGKPGTGKTSLAYAIAYELELEEVLVWSINTRTTLQDGLYYYDAIARLQDAQLEDDKPDIGHYIRLGALGTAMYPSDRPRVLLIDEIDKSDIDLPNDLLNLFEEGKFEIPELSRLVKNKNTKETENKSLNKQEKEVITQEIVKVQTHDGEWKEVPRGEIVCRQFPIVIMTSNAERDFPLPFKRRCLCLAMKPPERDELTKIIKSHFELDPKKKLSQEIEDLISKFINLRDKEEKELAIDQLLNAVFMLLGEQRKPTKEEKKILIDLLFTPLTETGDR